MNLSDLPEAWRQILLAHPRFDKKKSAIFSLLLVLLLAPTASAADEWVIEFDRPAIFLGDPINITVRGPPGNSTVEIRIHDANATLVSQYFASASNGVSRYNYSTSFDDPSGLWYVSAAIDGVIVVRKEIQVAYDDVQYLLKRQKFLEDRQERQEAFIVSLLHDQRELRNQILVLQFSVPIFILVGALIYYFAFTTSWTLRNFLVELRKELHPESIKYWWEKFETWLVAPDSSSELRQYHLRKRLTKPPKWPAKAIARRVREWGIEQGHVPMRPVRIVKKEG